LLIRGRSSKSNKAEERFFRFVNGEAINSDVFNEDFVSFLQIGHTSGIARVRVSGGSALENSRAFYFNDETVLIVFIVVVDLINNR